MFEYYTTRFQNKSISVQLEGFPENKFRALFPGKIQNTPFRVSINLFEFTYQMCLSRPITLSNTKRTKFNDYLGYTRRILDTDLLSFNLSEWNSEDKKQAADIIGEGMSRCLIAELFCIPLSTIVKVPLNGKSKRADFKGTTSQGISLACESKGSFSRIQGARVARAIDQKNSTPADLKIAAINHIGGLSRLIDPPGRNLERDRFERLAEKTQHYIQIFQLAGQKELAKYFRMMKKRFKLRNATNYNGFQEKQDLYFKLKNQSQSLHINEHQFVGNIELTNNNLFLYIGFDSQLLSVYDFERFSDYTKSHVEIAEGIKVFISTDGVCFVEGTRDKMSTLFPTADLNILKHFQESTLLNDIDMMNENAFKDYLTFVLKQSGIESQIEQKVGDRRVDMVLEYDNKEYYVEVKLSRNQQLTYSKKIRKLLESRGMIQENKILSVRYDFHPLEDKALYNQILITNKDRELVSVPKGVIVFDRRDIQKLTRNKEYLRDFLRRIESNHDGAS